MIKVSSRKKKEEVFRNKINHAMWTRHVRDLIEDYFIFFSDLKENNRNDE
jgi:hypothetical protein